MLFQKFLKLGVGISGRCGLFLAQAFRFPLPTPFVLGSLRSPSWSFGLVGVVLLAEFDFRLIHGAWFSSRWLFHPRSPPPLFVTVISTVLHFVFGYVRLIFEPLVANVTLKRLLPSMHFVMVLKPRFTHKTSSTGLTLEGAISFMNPEVVPQSGAGGERLWALRTLIRAFSSVHSHVTWKMGALGESFTAHTTHVRSLTSVKSLVCP